MKPASRHGAGKGGRWPCFCRARSYFIREDDEAADRNVPCPAAVTCARERCNDPASSPLNSLLHGMNWADAFRMTWPNGLRRRHGEAAARALVFSVMRTARSRPVKGGKYLATPAI